MDSPPLLLETLAQHTARLLSAASLAPRDPDLSALRAALGAWLDTVPGLAPFCDALDEILNAAPQQAARGLLRVRGLLGQWEAARLALAPAHSALGALPPAEPLYTRTPGTVIRAIWSGLRGLGDYPHAAALDLAEGRSATRDLRLLSAWAEAAGAAWFPAESRARIFSGLGALGLSRLRAAFHPQGNEEDARRLETLCALLPPEEAAELAAWAMREGSAEVRGVALARWSALSPTGAAAYALDLARDPETPEALRATAATLLRYAPSQEALDWLLSTLEEETPPLRRAAAYALQGFGAFHIGDSLTARLDPKLPAPMTEALLRALSGPLSDAMGARLVGLWWDFYRKGPHRQAAEEAIGRAAGVVALREFAEKLPSSTRTERLRKLLGERLAQEPALLALLA